MRMTPDEIQFFESALAASGSYLEYGAGGSTLLASKLPQIKKILCVESDPNYVEEHIRADPSIEAAIAEGRLGFRFVDVGATKDWGYPENDDKKHLWPNYALCPYLDKNRPDLVLVDGRFRVACALAAGLEATSARILVHDYTIRDEYRILERFFNIKESVQTLAELVKKPDFDVSEAKALLSKYLYSPGDQSPLLPARARRVLGNIKRKIVKSRIIIT